MAISEHGIFQTMMPSTRHILVITMDKERREEKAKAEKRRKVPRTARRPKFASTHLVNARNKKN